ncbi:efflux protein [Moniliophthora roreri]|uniref:Major facilitator superfamily (MFS) profile domain-containing protein n=1 Tax=Moniliophthora roreri TaxID=221103 RepID=A0A0W0FW84_MONRR|nr:efflux protein [Moniliophthora roreri]
MNERSGSEGRAHYSTRRSIDVSSTTLEKEIIEFGHGKEKRSTRKSFMLVAACTLAMMVNIGNSTGPSIALPTIERELNVQQIQLVWIASGYALSSGCLLLLFGRLADLYGRKKAFLLGNLWLFIFTLSCAFAKNSTALNVLRGFQGVGAAATIPASLGILAHAFPPSRARSIAFACFAAGAPVGGAFGIVIGGVLIQETSQTWRATFYLSTGLTFLSLVLGFFSIDGDEPSTELDRRIDWPDIVGLLIAGVFLVLLFVVWQHYLETVQDYGLRPRADRWIPTLPPLMKLSLWSRADGKVAIVFCIALFNWCSFLAWSYWVMIFYQNYMGFDPIATMIRLIPMFITGIICNVVVALVVGRVSLVALMAMGTALTSSASLLFAIIDPDAVYWAFGFPAAITAVVGADFVFAAGTLFIAKVSLPHEQSIAGALGTSLGITISTVVFNRIIQQQSNQLGVPITEVPKPGQLKSYKAAQWTNFAFGVFAALLAVKYLRGVGIVGHRKEKLSDDAEVATVQEVPRSGRYRGDSEELPKKRTEKDTDVQTSVVDVDDDFSEPSVIEERRSYR